MVSYEELMKRCIELAKQGIGNTSPNPLVGAVVLDKDDNIISEGFHKKYGENHAERDALLKLNNGEEKGGTIVVNLEPCSHFGKTPPCADLIIERGLKKVVVGCVDSNSKVGGKGIQKLLDAGIEVVVGVLENECRELNEVFFKNVEDKKVFVALKTATTIDGKISTSTGDSKWIASQKSREFGRELRTYYDAILTSSTTVLADNPTMKHKKKIVLDRELKTDFNAQIYQEGQIFLVVDENLSVENYPDNFEIIRCKTVDDKFDLSELMQKLFDMGIKSVFVEAGGKLCGEFIKRDLVDKLYHFVAPKILNDNTGRSCFDNDTVLKISDSKSFRLVETKIFDNDILAVYKTVTKCFKVNKLIG
ncbi:bifunctional diaminohydroxyphosphoribosylaminopyrimidine deaminase/5-amino-6-(5-phosphoribosylamino)uracil reductase RibD [bacterium]|nr:bifunctional diaminohydroxyphosphoribosylaminopyrimidine deaminase/5-amino-6-(5-phosphoribosylamino)uracil reductase RibD [bacterium]